MSGGFSGPWLLNFIKGILVGGHAMFVRGYDRDYNGEVVFRVRNSFGSWYGDNGDLYIKEADMAEKGLKYYGAYVNYDIAVDIAKFLHNFNGMAVKEAKGNDVYLIEDGKKRRFPDMATFYVHGFLDEDIRIVDIDYINKTDTEDDVDFWDGQGVKLVKAMLLREEDIKEIFIKYFSELE